MTIRALGIAGLTVWMLGCGGAGPSGDEGPAGPTGVMGTMGTMGTPGATGPSGTMGAMGTMGAEGATGPAGMGTPGATGPQGATGPAGATVSPPPGPLGPRTSTDSSGTFVGTSAGNPASLQDTAIGKGALPNDTDVNGQNTAVGFSALSSLTAAHGNVAVGYDAMRDTTIGSDNVAIGNLSLLTVTTGAVNVAVGYGAGQNTNGSENTIVGVNALFYATDGDLNIAIGDIAGYHTTPMSGGDIYLGSAGPAADASEQQTMRLGYFPIDGTLGLPATTNTYIAGISGVTSASGVEVFINTAGKLGTVTSSRVFKHEIRDMGGDSDALMRLRPVSFKYKPELDGDQLKQYGLVAEEVAAVDKGLVAYKTDGAPETVRYHFINAMLLNEVQKQHRHIEEQEAHIKALNARLESIEKRLAGRPAR
jgi:hypothetical protein